MHAVPPVALASVLVPLALLAGGFVVLVAGLALLTGRPPLRTRRSPPRNEDLPACDWAADLELDGGERVRLRAPDGTPCCLYVLRVRDRHRTAAVETRTDELSWSGTDTRLDPEGATTPLTRDVVSRRLAPGPIGAVADLARERSAGPVVTTPGWEDVPAPTPHAVQTRGRTMSQVWHRHIDDLRASGARPTDDEPVAARLHHRDDLEVSLTVTRGCTTAPGVTTVEGTCEAGLEAHATGAAPAQRLGSWLDADGLRLAARTPVGAPVGVASDACAPDTTVLEVVVDPSADATRAAWCDRAVTTSTDATVRIRMGTSIELAAEGEIGREPARTALHAEASTRVRIRTGPDPGSPGAGVQPGTAPCRRCVARIEFVLGSSQPVGHLRLDGRDVQLQRPTPGSTGTSWTVVRTAVEDVGAVTPQR